MRLKKARVMAERSITIKFDGQLHQVDLNTFTKVLLDYSEVVRQSAQETGLDSPVKISIKATERGSLDVILAVVADGFSGLLEGLNDNTGLIESLSLAVTTATGLFGFKKWLAGKKGIDSIEPKDNNTSIVSADGDVTIVNNGVINVYQNRPSASHAISNAFSSLEENPAVEGFEIISDGESEFRAERSEFAGIASSPDFENDSVRHEQKRCTVTVVRPCLANQKNRKWRIFYENLKEVPAVITDESFMENLHEHSFTIGTQMDVELDITQELDLEVGAFVNTTYDITKVYEVIPPPEIIAMF